LECLSFPGCTYTIRTGRGCKGHPVSPLSFAFSRKIDSGPSPRRSFHRSGILSPLSLTMADRSLPSWPFVLIREISLELRVKRGKGEKEGCDRGRQPRVNSQLKHR